MRKVTTELSVGLFMIMGFLAFVYLSLQLGEFSVFALEKNYPINAEFDNVSGLKPGATVEIAGVTVGKVSAISLDEYDMAKVTMLISRDVSISDDAIASIRTQGLIGDKYIRIAQVGSGERLPDNGTILETESAVDLEALISKYIFGKI
ncbi:MAG: outer membrane lipid asymmetry maintenance protein MlaD [Deltaproteobacteria bacterium RIFOXYD12_FULL_57_12]|nr:MAG: outer membrane lipid asymmetry maintenance protein MlaD [Deltaproteobacteria bacterium RIFOXYD12_FULL_57_12]